MAFSNPDKFVAGFGLTVILAVLAGIAGWIINLFKLIYLTGSTFNEAGVELVLRIVGIPVPPLGAIMGLFVW